jgi:hypothetical protein
MDIHAVRDGLYLALRFLLIGGAISFAAILAGLCVGERVKTMAALLVARKHTEESKQERARNSYSSGP